MAQIQFVIRQTATGASPAASLCPAGAAGAFECRAESRILGKLLNPHQTPPDGAGPETGDRRSVPERVKPAAAAGSSICFRGICRPNGVCRRHPTVFMLAPRAVGLRSRRGSHRNRPNE
jgi:hypothetical protein